MDSRNKLRIRRCDGWNSWGGFSLYFLKTDRGNGIPCKSRKRMAVSNSVSHILESDYR